MRPQEPVGKGVRDKTNAQFQKLTTVAYFSHPSQAAFLIAVGKIGNNLPQPAPVGERVHSLAASLQAGHPKRDRVGGVVALLHRHNPGNDAIFGANNGQGGLGRVGAGRTQERQEGANRIDHDLDRRRSPTGGAAGSLTAQAARGRTSQGVPILGRPGGCGQDAPGAGHDLRRRRRFGLGAVPSIKGASSACVSFRVSSQLASASSSDNHA
jgi:hypothetical protein